MFQNFSRDRCYIIAEIGCLFTSVEQARRLIDAAAACQVDAIKLQTFRAETIASRTAMFDMENTGVVSQFDLFRKYEVDERMHQEIFAYVKQKGLDWFSTPSHESDVELLLRQGVGVIKIGSDDAVNLPFLRNVARTRKPVILSTGMCTLEEVRQSVDLMLANGCPQLILLHCVTSYPTHPDQVNLKAMQAMAREFPQIAVGYSDHVIGPLACLAAVAMGARVIEKHFTLDKAGPEPDAMLSADPPELRKLVQDIRSLEAMLGDGIKRPAQAESTTRVKNRKSVVAAAAVEKGQPFTTQNLAIKRPGHGIQPKDLHLVLGRRAARNVAADDVLGWEDLA